MAGAKRETIPMFRTIRQMVDWLRKSPFGRRVLRQCHPYAFDSLQEIEKWLGTTSEGSDLLQRFEGARRKVLIVLYSDGWVEAYAGKDVDVRIVNKIHATTPEGGQMAERILELSLPRVYAELLWPGNRRASGQVRKVTAQQVLDARMELDVLEAIDQCE